MLYTSTRDSNVRVSSAEAITRGISGDGGLFVPVEIPQLTLDQIVMLSRLDYKGRAKEILKLYLTDFTDEELSDCVNGAYGGGKFSSEKIAPLVPIEEGVDILELWKGPTCAFKDMALQLLPHLLTKASEKTGDHKTIVILVATSGDTGKAALEGFRDVPNTKITVFYPRDGVSPMQKLQMVTQEGGNVSVVAIEGNFDDAQSGVKEIFTDPEVNAELNSHGMMFSSANSINWGRLVPQIVYYISAYCDALNDGRIEAGEKINIVVPTGNFGNILAAYYALRMGLPVNKLICASNKNNVLTDFLKTGRYDRNRDFYVTSSPSMDILISSNLERLLYLATDMDDMAVRGWMHELSTTGSYDIGEDLLGRIQTIFSAGCCDEEGTKATINGLFNSQDYLCDTHTAVAVNTYFGYRSETGDDTHTVIASTASPFKFCAGVLDALEVEFEGDELEKIHQLSKVTGEECPPQLASLTSKEIRFKDCCTRENMKETVLRLCLKGE
ncbi:MAG: threonine synthase [Clostridiales bacterium]|nr:threonine synthase [Clostridiales bacterium]